MSASARRQRIVVLASGNGSNFQAIVEAARSGALAADIVGLVTDRPDAQVTRRATDAGVSVDVVVVEPGEQRSAYDIRLADVVSSCSPDLVVLAGWMRLLSMGFLGRFPHRVINIHPALPGQFAGTHAIERALDAARHAGLAVTGAMVHFVPGEGVDDGPVIATSEVAIEETDTIDTLTARVHAAEHELIVRALRLLTEGLGTERSG